MESVKDVTLFVLIQNPKSTIYTDVLFVLIADKEPTTLWAYWLDNYSC